MTVDHPPRNIPARSRGTTFVEKNVRCGDGFYFLVTAPWAGPPLVAFPSMDDNNQFGRGLNGTRHLLRQGISTR